MHTHIWIALASVCLGHLTLTVWSGTGLPPVLAVFLFGGTLSAYTLQRSVGYTSLATERKQGIDRIRLSWPWLILAGSAMAIWAWIQLPMNARLVALGAGGLAVAYILPVGTGRRVRNLPLVKIFLIAGTWALATAILPLLTISAPAGPTYLLLAASTRLLFILAITLPFDLRDAEEDRQSGTLTLPRLLGWPRARILALIFLFGSLVLDNLLHHVDADHLAISSSQAITCLLAGTLIWRARPDADDLYFSFWLDGVMILPCLVLALFT